MNRIIIVGRLTGYPELRATQSGTSVATFNVAVNRRFDKEKADFFRIVTWRGLADNCARYLEKGQQVAVEGELQIQSYTAKDGTTRTAVEINANNVEFLAKAGQRTEAPPAQESDFELYGGELVEEDALPF